MAAASVTAVTSPATARVRSAALTARRASRCFRRRPCPRTKSWSTRSAPGGPRDLECGDALLDQLTAKPAQQGIVLIAPVPEQAGAKARQGERGLEQGDR